MRIVIVGNGPAALGAVEAIRERDDECDITILSPEDVRAYTPCFLAKYVAGTIEAGALALKHPDFYEQHRVELRTGQAVTAVLPEEGAVVLEDGSLVPYDRLLLACGAKPVVPDVPNLPGAGVCGFGTLGDAEGIRAQAGPGRNVVVLGSGFVAMEIAEALAETGATVTVVARKDRILRRIFDAEVSAMVEDHMSRNGVVFTKGRELTSVERDADTGVITAAVLSDGERLPCDLLVVSVGTKANIGMVEGTAVATDHGIITDSAMRTSVPGIFAVGDVAEMEIDGVRKVNLIHPNAVATGRIAGYNMLGAEELMNEHLSDMNVLTVFGRSFLSAGSVEGARVLRRSIGTDGLVKIFANEDGTIKGVQLVGDVTRGGLYASLITRNISVDSVPDILSARFNYGQTVGVS